MPNGDPNWHLTKLPQLESFFAPLANEIERFANEHNLEVSRYYHQFPDWSLQFVHPAGGDATINIRPVGDAKFVLIQIWWIDDYDRATRSSKTAISPEFRVDEANLTAVLSQALSEIVEWKPNAWSQVDGGYERIWHEYTREQFESMRPKLPKVRLRPDTT